MVDPDRPKRIAANIPKATITAPTKIPIKSFRFGRTAGEGESASNNCLIGFWSAGLGSCADGCGDVPKVECYNILHYQSCQTAMIRATRIPTTGRSLGLRQACRRYERTR